jgi:S1-C subfamily serine protease
MDHTLYINWFDVIIVLLLVAFVWFLRKAGLLTHLLLIVGFFGGLFFGGWLFPHLLPLHDATLKTIINENLVLLFSVYLGAKGYDLGKYLDYKFKKIWLHKLDIGLGVIFNICFGLIVIWLVASMIGRLPFAGLSNSANNSLIVQLLDNHLPPIPAVFLVFNRAVNPNNPAEVFVHANQQVEVYEPISSPSLNAAAIKAGNSMVRVTSFGCGDLLSGSGFVVAPNVIITNAHVIAGAHRPIIKYGSQSYAGTVVLFNPNLDLAAIRVSGLIAPSLTLDKQEVMAGTPVVALGYPNGNYSMLAGVVRDEQVVYGSDIYGVGAFGREIYEVQAQIQQGSSGGPLILQDGQVAGVVFARSGSIKDDGFALDSQSLFSSFSQAEHSTRRVGTGVCVSD